MSFGLLVLPGKLTAPDIRHAASAGRKLIPPGEFRTLQPATGRELPFGFGRKFLATPARIGFRILIGDLHHGMRAGGSRASFPRPSGRRQFAPGNQRHQLRMSRKFNGPVVLSKASAPGASISGAAPG